MNLTVDISHILRWQGRLTGIERTEYNLIKYYLEKQAKFTYWDDELKAWIEADQEYVKTNVLNRSSSSVSKLDPSVFTRTTRRLKNRFKKSDKISAKKATISQTFLIPAGLWDNEAYIQSLEQLSGSTKLVHVIYDMIPLVQPGYVVDYLPKVFGNYMLRVLPVCHTVLAISNNSKQDTEKVLEKEGLAIPSIKVIRLGDDITTEGEDKRPDGVPEKYILSVGTIEARKNHQLFGYVYKLAEEKNIFLPPIVVAGKRGWHTESLLHLFENDPYFKEKIIILDDIDDASLRWLYKNTQLTVFPSIYEGWGLPVAESLAYGKVTLSSNSSSMPEVGGVYADYFSPHSPNELLELLNKYSKNSLRSLREEQIKSEFKLVTWEEALISVDKQIAKLI